LSESGFTGFEDFQDFEEFRVEGLRFRDDFNPKL
jgi:hypothetical protein